MADRFGCSFEAVRSNMTEQPVDRWGVIACGTYDGVALASDTVHATLHVTQSLPIRSTSRSK